MNNYDEASYIKTCHVVLLCSVEPVCTWGSSVSPCPHVVLPLHVHIFFRLVQAHKELNISSEMNGTIRNTGHCRVSTLTLRQAD